MIGILLILMHEMSSCTPPLSPPDMPSTSSMISTIFFFGPPKKDIARFVTISRIAFEALPPTPSRMSLLLFPRVSDAFTSVTSNPSCLAMIVAALLFPMPGGPLMSTAFIGLSLPLASARGCAPVTWMSSHVDKNLRRSAICLPLPMSCAGAEGLYLFTHSGVGSSALAGLEEPLGPAPAAEGAEGLEGAAAGAQTGATSSRAFGTSSTFEASPALRAHSATIANRPSSSMRVVPCSLALLYLDWPQSVPTRR